MPAGGGTNPACFHQIPPGLCVSTPTRAALERVLELSRRDVPIALYGETGTGKDALAQAIHHASARPGRLVALNCAAIPEAMAEGMLFGHRKGAFTGAQTSEEGHVRAAHRGTLFLDEIADLSLGVQAKLLRVLEERQVTPLGATEPQPVDFRLIAACQEPLEALVAHGDFRADLYARLSGIELCLSPLRERRQEVPRLFSTFWSEAGRPAPRLEGPLVEALCGYDWPYNVREVRQLAQLLEASGKLQLGLADLPERLRLAPTPAALPAPERSVSRDVAEAPARRAAWLSRHARELDALQRALQQHDGNVSSAALEAGVPRHRARRLLAAQAEMHGSRK
jgi:transcriptional regulator with PAS, ATPase and Fis domain